VPRSRRFTPSASVRRRRVWARSSSPVTVSTTASALDLLALFEFASGGRLSLGSTIGAVNLNLIVTRTAGTALNAHFAWGLVVAPRTADPADLDPIDFGAAAGAHMDWMFWTAQAVSNSVSSEQY